MNHANDRVTFERRRFPFADLVLGEINRKLAEEGCAPLSNLSDIHTIEGVAERLEEFRQALFAFFRTPIFQRVYRDFGAHLIDKYFTPEAVIQKTPTVRIQLDGGRSVSFHSDAWYGHGQRVCSFWLPLVTVSGSNSLQMARDRAESREFLDSIPAARLDLDAINALAASMCDPVEAGFGDLIVFNGDMVHGTLDNKSGSSRVSFDFRIADSLQEIGTKPANNFYTRDDLEAGAALESSSEPDRNKPRRRAYMYSGLCRGVSAKSQLIFLNEYAKVNQIDIVGSESEIVVFDYCPVLLKYAKSPVCGMNTLLLFSVDLLPPDRDSRQRIYSGSRESGVRLVFAAEDLVIDAGTGVEQVEHLLAERARGPVSTSQQTAAA